MATYLNYGTLVVCRPADDSALSAAFLCDLGGKRNTAEGQLALGDRAKPQNLCANVAGTGFLSRKTAFPRVKINVVGCSQT